MLIFIRWFIEIVFIIPAIKRGYEKLFEQGEQGLLNLSQIFISFKSIYDKEI